MTMSPPAERRGTNVGCAKVRCMSNVCFLASAVRLRMLQAKWRANAPLKLGPGLYVSKVDDAGGLYVVNGPLDWSLCVLVVVFR